MATKLPAAQKRLFGNVFICRRCNKKVRSQMGAIILGKIKCPRCNSRVFRPVRKK